ncbi:MAG: MBL fold metallo-hydrolase [Pseudomonadota bacterium]
MTKSMHIKATILGCGSSGGVPRPGGPDGDGEWGACDPAEPKNRRKRCSLLIEAGAANAEEKTTLLVDTSPDLRAQLLAARCRSIDAVLFTHDHADQTHGIDDLRPLVISMRRQIPAYLDEGTAGGLLHRFSYCFEQPPGSYYPPILERRDMPPCGKAFVVEGPGGPAPVIAFLQHHGGVDSLGFRFGPIAYSSDVVGLPEESFAILEGVDTWIVDALQMKPHKTHAHLDLALEWIERVRPRRAVLTNLHVHMDYQSLKTMLPDHIEPAYDGLVVDSEYSRD